MIPLNSRFSCNIKIVCRSDHVYADLLYPGRRSGMAKRNAKLKCFSLEGSGPSCPFPLVVWMEGFYVKQR